ACTRRTRGPATNLDSTRVLVSIGAGGTIDAGGRFATGISSVRVLDANAVPSTSAPTAARPAIRAGRLMRLRSTTHAASPSNSSCATVVGQVGYTPKASTDGKNSALAAGTLPETCSAWMPVPMNLKHR